MKLGLAARPTFIGRSYRLLTTVILGVAVGALATMAILLFSGTKIDEQAWSLFLNAKLPLILTQVSVPLLVLLLVDLGTPGRTVSAICDVDPTDAWQEKATAAAFLLGLTYVMVQAVKGGF
jgi:hypothetical protein